MVLHTCFTMSASKPRLTDTVISIDLILADTLVLAGAAEAFVDVGAAGRVGPTGSADADKPVDLINAGAVMQARSLGTLRNCCRKKCL